MKEKSEQRNDPDTTRVQALRNLPSEVMRRLTKAEVKAFLFDDEWPDSLQEKLKDYLTEARVPEDS